MRKFIFVLLTLLLVSPFSFAMKGIIWQPQNRDSQVTDTQWQGLMSQLRLQGFDTLVLQWTRYGDAFTQPEQRALLFKRAAAAQQAGLKLIVGLNADPEFFMHQKQSSAALESYLNRLLAADLQQARLWSAAPGVTPDGWYISAEIDDLNWRSEAARQPLLTWLNNEQRLISDVSAKPVYISSFFAGNMSPDAIANCWNTLKQPALMSGYRMAAAWINLPLNSVNVIYRPAPIAKAPPQQAALFMNCLSPAKAKPLQRNRNRTQKLPRC